MATSTAGPTLGLEDELAALDPHHWNLRSIDVDQVRRDEPRLENHASKEFHACVLELKTGVHASAQAAVDELRLLRQRGAGAALNQGLRLAALAVHPFARWQDATVHSDPVTDPHYARLLQAHGDIARSMLTFGLHVHVGLSDPDARARLFNLVREFIPVFTALSAAAPFWEGRDTGLKSIRPILLDRYPRCGIPEPIESAVSHLAWLDTLDRLQVTGPQGVGSVWGHVRWHRTYPTIEVRVFDAQPDLGAVSLLARLCEAAGRMAQAMDLPTYFAAVQQPGPTATPLLRENQLLATQQGVSAPLLHWSAQRRESVLDQARRLLAPAGDLGLRDALEALDADLRRLTESGSFADQLRRRLSGADRPDLPALVRWVHGRSDGLLP